MYASVSRISLSIHKCDNFETLFKTLQVYSLARASQSKTACPALIIRFPQFKSRARFPQRPYINYVYIAQPKHHSRSPILEGS